jgi:hypothetical protein
MSTRRYTDSEVRAIFERAAARQEAARRRLTAGEGGLTLEELQAIGAETGIDPAHVASAAAEVDAAGPAPDGTFLGAPVEVTRTRALPAPVSDAAWARMVAELRRAFGDDGAAGQLGPVREWTAVGRGLRRDLSTRFAVEPDPSGDGVRLVLRQSTREIARILTLVGGFTAVMAALFAGLALAGVDPAEMWPSVILLLAMTLAFGGGAQLGLRRWAARQERKFEALLDRMELIARSTSPPLPAPPTALPDAAVPAGTMPALDLDRLPDPEEEPQRRASWRTRT